MSYIKISIMFIIHTLLLPLKVVVALVCRMMWSEVYDDAGVVKQKNNIDECRKWALRMESGIDREEVLWCGDGPKYLGLLALATQKESDWEYLYKYICHPSDGMGWRMTRYPGGDKDGDGEIQPSFSGDQIVGMLAGISMAHNKGYIKPYQYEALREVFREVVFGKRPFFMGHKEDSGRGWLYRPYVLGPECITALLFLEVGASVLQVKGMRTLCKIFYLLHLPLLMFHYDYNMWMRVPFVGDVICLTWFAPHTRYMSAYVGNKYFTSYGHIWKRVVRYYRKKYPYNCCYTLDTVMAWEFMLGYVRYGKGTEDAQGVPMRDVFSLRSLSKKQYSHTPLPPQYRGQKDVWEDCPYVGYTCTDNRRKQWCMDAVTSIYLYL